MLAAFLRGVASLVVRDSGSDSRISATARPGSLFAYGKEMCVVGAIRLHCYVSPAAVSFGCVPPRSFFSYTLLVGFSKKFFYRLDAVEAVIVIGRDELEAIIVGGKECFVLHCVGEGRRIEGPSDRCDDYYETVTLAAVFVLAEEAYICHTASGDVCNLVEKVIDKRHAGCCPLSIFWECACCRVARFYIIQFFVLLVKRAFYDEGF